MSSKKTGLTLLEVVAALGLLATLLVALLTAHNRLAAQTLRGERRLAAIAAADELLATWTLTSPMTIPAPRGEINHSPKLYWRITSESDLNLTALGCQRATLVVTDTPFTDSKTPALATVDFLTTAVVPMGGAQ